MAVKEKGVSLIITFFITIIILFVVLGISAILYSQIKIIRNIGNSVIAFYVADSGVEKVLYYDRKVISGDPADPSATVKRGLCSICDLQSPSCPTDEVVDSSINCICEAPVALDSAGKGCKPSKCTDCEVKFSTIFDSGEKSYNVIIRIQPDSLDEDISYFTVSSFGSYENVKRAVELNTQEGGVSEECIDAISIDNAYVDKFCVPYNTDINITASISDPTNQVDESTVVATIISAEDPNFVVSKPLILTSGDLQDGIWTNSWTAVPPAPLGFYYIYISASDSMDCDSTYLVPPFDVGDTCP